MCGKCGQEEKTTYHILASAQVVCMVETIQGSHRHNNSGLQHYVQSPLKDPKIRGTQLEVTETVVPHKSILVTVLQDKNCSCASDITGYFWLVK
jgi:hypothetical protein